MSFLGTYKLQIILIPERYNRLHKTTRETCGRKGKSEKRLLNKEKRENWTEEETMVITLKPEQDTPLDREMRKTTT
jgi:hypothetical protein